MQKIFLKYCYVFLSLTSLITSKAKKSQKNSDAYVAGDVADQDDACELKILRTPLFICLLVFSNIVLAQEQVFKIDIPAQNAARALEMLAEQTGAITLFPYDIATQVQANSVVGQYTLEEALHVLLENSGLLAGLSNQRVITIKTMVVPPNQKEEKAMSKPVSKKSKILAVLSSLLMSVSGNAHESKEPGAHLLEEVRVTARRTEESLMTTPLSISTLDTAQLQQSGIRTIVDLAEYTPGFQIENDLGRRSQRPVMRGLENSRPEAAQPVSIYVDGIFTRSGLYSVISESVERVEIVKGPQAASYSRSAIGGVVNYISRRPEERRLGKLSLSIAEHNNIELDAYFSGSLGDKISADFGLHHYEYDGEYKNRSSLSAGARALGAEETNAVYGALYYQPTERLELVARVYHSEDKDGQIAARFQSDRSCPGSICTFGVVPEIDNLNVVTSIENNTLIETEQNGSFLSAWDFKAGLDREISRVAGSAKFEITDDLDIEWLSGYTIEDISDSSNQSYSSRIFYEFPVDLFTRPLMTVRDERTELEYISNEIRLRGEQTTFDWTFGISHFREKRETSLRDLLSAEFTSLVVTDLEELSSFYQLMLPVSKNLSFDFEGRLDSQKLNSDIGSVELLDLDNTAFNYRVSLDYKWSDDLFLYSSFSNSEKLLGSNTQPDLQGDLENIYGKERVEQFEVGIKTNLAQGHVRFNASAFWLEQKEEKVESTPFSIFDTYLQIYSPFRSLPNATEVRGLELDFQWLINDDWYVSTNYALSDSEFTNAARFGITSLNGLQRPRIPKHAVNALVQYSYALSNSWTSKTTMNIAYNSSRQGEELNIFETGDQLDLGLRTSLVKDKLELSVWMDNLLDDRTPVNAQRSNVFGDSGYTTYLPRGRQAGVTLKYQF